MCTTSSWREREREREREVTCNSKAQGCIALHHANLERIHAVVIMMMSIMPYFVIPTILRSVS